MGLTKKELSENRIEASTAMYSIALDIEYSIEMYDDYNSDLKLCIKDNNASQRKLRAKLKKIITRYEEATGRKYTGRKK